MKARAAAALVAACVSTGCASAPTAPTGALVPSATATVQLRLASPYGLKSVVSGYTVADVDHVRLELYRAGTLVSGADATVPVASLGTAVTLRNLRAATRYEVRATAFADAAEATVISDVSASSATFTTPAVVTTAGIAAIDDAAVAVPVALALAKRAVGARLVFKVLPTGFIRNKSTHVRIKLLAGTSLVSERVETLVAAELSHTLTNLKLGTTYSIVTQGLTLAPEVQQSVDAASTLTFSTPAAGATSVEDDMNVVLAAAVASVPCSK